ncbi:MAG: tetratricopeptide repeat protein [Candidatus Krumholzibacteria bacterium]|nr:tetratricopeptide repeat protein [Candidatus Krumholzibacteria bacterium]
MIPLIALLAALACGSESILDKAAKEYEAGSYREAIFLIRHHIKKGGQTSAELMLLFGKSWLKTGSEAEAQSAFEECAKKDASYGPKIAQFLRSEAISSIKASDEARGKRMMMLALDFQSGLDFGEYNLATADLYLQKRDYDMAVFYLEKYLHEFPDASGAAEAMIELASAYEKKGDPGKAISIYRRFQDSYPKSRLATDAVWELESLLLREAETLYGEGQVSEAESVLVELQSRGGSPLVKERTSFLLGEICEKRSDVANAIRYYRDVVNAGSSGRLVEKAKERIEKLEMQKRRR